LPRLSHESPRTGRPPRAVTADRGYGDTSAEAHLHELGVKAVVIPRKAKPGQARRAIKHRRAFRKMVKWRTGSEGRISNLKRNYGWNRTLITGLEGARIHCGHGVFVHNLIKIGALAA